MLFGVFLLGLLMGCIYLARCKVNGKGYIGFTFDLTQRQEGHKRDAYDGSILAFHCAIRKYGWDAFEWSILYQDEDDDREWMGWWERKFIRELKTKVPNGYNMTDGGDGGAIRFGPHTEETKRKIANRSYVWSDESRKKMSIASKGRIVTEETRRKISEAGIGRKQSEEARAKNSVSKIGHIVTKETRRKISESCKGKKRPADVNARIVAAQTGQKRSPEVRARMSTSAKKNWKISESRRNAFSFRGRKHTEESRAKMRETKALKKLRENNE